MTETTREWDGIDRRQRSRDSLVADIASAIRCEMASLTVPEDTHREHHAFISQWIEERKRKAERWDKIRTQVTGWGIVSLLGAIGTGVVHAAAYLKEHLK